MPKGFEFYGCMSYAHCEDDCNLVRQTLAAFIQKKHSANKRKTRQAKARENAKKAPRTFLELVHEVRTRNFA